MGSCDTYKCGNCGMSATVSGGRSEGMLCFTTTVWCSKCKNMSDIVKEYREEVQGETPPFVCGNCRSKKIIEWNYSQPCPQCGGKIVVDPEGEAYMWD